LIDAYGENPISRKGGVCACAWNTILRPKNPRRLIIIISLTTVKKMYYWGNYALIIISIHLKRMGAN
jgi:hypothetical protein